MPSLPKLPIFLLIFIGITAVMIVRLYQGTHFSEWRAWAPILLWLCGGLLGYVVLVFDRLVDVYVGNPETKLSIYVRESFAAGRFRQGWQVLYNNRHLQTKLTFRSIIFHLVWVALALFTVTSTTATFGKGFIMGLGLHLLLDEWDDYLKDKGRLRQWLFWQVNREIPFNELKIFMIIVTVITLVYFLLIIY